MQFKQLPMIVIVTAPTRMQGLVARWGTKGQAHFRIKQAVKYRREVEQSSSLDTVAEEADFVRYESEDDNYRQVIRRLRSELDFGPPVTVIERQYLPNYDFRNALLVVVVGHDGLVANTAKYVGDLPIIGVNPDPARNDGVLLPVNVNNCRSVVSDVLKQQARITQVTMAAARLNDGQSILAFNDLFIGRRNHVSARYNISYSSRAETQSSSGIIVATGAGSTGWLSSVFNMVRGVTQVRTQVETVGIDSPNMTQRTMHGISHGNTHDSSLTDFVARRGVRHAEKLNSSSLNPTDMSMSDARLAWVVREPFASKHSQASMVMGYISASDELVVESLMPEGGVIFSDGIESDFIEFNSGATAKITLADHQAQLVTP